MYKSLSISGEITVVKTFVLSKISHSAAVLPPPTPKKCALFDDVIHDFIRGKTKNSFVPVENLPAQKELLGLGFQNA